MSITDMSITISVGAAPTGLARTTFWAGPADLTTFTDQIRFLWPDHFFKQCYATENRHAKKETLIIALVGPARL